MSDSTDGLERPKVFFDIQVGDAAVGRLEIELFRKETPKTCENFQRLCAGSDASLSYNHTPFHSIIPGHGIEGGDISNKDGTGQPPSSGGYFEDENLGWREIDSRGLLCLSNRGEPNTNTGQFFVTLAPAPTLRTHTVFGHVTHGSHILDHMESVRTDANNHPTTPITISACGSLTPFDGPGLVSDSPLENRGRHKRRRRQSATPARSASPSRGHTRDSGSRHRHHYRNHRRSTSSTVSSPPLKRRDRRRSDASPDHTLRGRRRNRSRSRSALLESDSEGNEENRERKHRKRSVPPSRHLSKETVGDGQEHKVRRQRSFPNIYRESGEAATEEDEEQALDDEDRDTDMDRKARLEADTERAGKGADVDMDGYVGGGFETTKNAPVEATN